jgi:ABC-type multidrug transport system fused ATPase/permease subunit
MRCSKAFVPSKCVAALCVECDRLLTLVRRGALCCRYAWEEPFGAKIEAVRGEEINKMKVCAGHCAHADAVIDSGTILATCAQTSYVFRSLTIMLMTSSPSFVLLITFLFYSVVENHSMEAAAVFTAITIFDRIRLPMLQYPQAIAAWIDVRVRACVRACVTAPRPALSYARTCRYRCNAWASSWRWTRCPQRSSATRQARRWRRTWRRPPARPFCYPCLAATRLAHHSSPARWSSSRSTPAGPAAPQSRRPATSSCLRPPRLRSTAALTMRQSASRAQLSSGQRTCPVRARRGETSLSVVLARTALEGVTFTVPKGSLTAVVGPVGAGKSALCLGLLSEARERAASRAQHAV